MEIVFLLPDGAAFKPVSSAKPLLKEDLWCTSTPWYLKHLPITTGKQAMIMPISEMKNWHSEKRRALPIIAKCIPSFSTYSAGTYLLHARPTPGIYRYSAEQVRSRIQICTCLTPKPLPIGDHSAWRGPSSHSQRPVEIQVWHTGPTPTDRFSRGESIRPALYPGCFETCFLLKLPHP